LHESLFDVCYREVNWFATNDVPINAVEVPEVGWRTKDEQSKKGLVKDEGVAPSDDVCVNIVRPNLS
jgi:hypothetical protein